MTPGTQMGTSGQLWGDSTLRNFASTSTAVPQSHSSSIPAAPVARSTPLLPPKPPSLYRSVSGFGMPSYGGFSSSYGSGYGGYGSNYSSGYGGLNSYGSYGMPYNSYGMGYNSMYNPYSTVHDDAERRFIQYAEESSRRTFANVESIVRAFNSIAMMLDNTFFAMTSSFRAVLSVAENIGRLKNMFGHIWYSINLFRLFSWLYRKLMDALGYKQGNASSIAWKQAGGIGPPPPSIPSGSSWPTLAFFGVLVSAPYIISKFLPKFEDKSDPSTWNSPGVRAKAAFDFIPTSPSELAITTNDILTIAPTYIQESMNLKNSGWAFAISKGKSGLVPLNYLLISKPSIESAQQPIPVLKSEPSSKTHTKRVSFGENQIFENIDLDDVIKKAEDEAKQYKKNCEKSVEVTVENDK